MRAMSVTIKTADPRVAGAITEGVSTVQLRAVQQEYHRLQALDGVRRNGDAIRWERTRRRLARKYQVRPMGRLRGAVLGAWALAWYGLVRISERLSSGRV